MDALELAVESEPCHFFAQLKYAELHYRLRTLIRAEEETLKAVERAGKPGGRGTGLFSRTLQTGSSRSSGPTRTRAPAVLSTSGA